MQGSKLLNHPLTLGVNSEAERQAQWLAKHQVGVPVYHLMRKRASIWLRFHSLNQTYKGLLKKARDRFNRNRTLYLKIQEDYWYETACLLEERRKFLAVKDLFRKTLIQPFVTGTPIHTSSDQRFDQEKGDSSKPVSLTLIVILFLLSGISVTSGALWLLPLNVLGW